MKYLLIIWIAFLGADRVDFGLGKAGFTITPFIFISVLIFVTYCTSNIIKRRIPTIDIDYIRKIKWLSLLLFPYIFMVLISVIFGNDSELGAKRFILLCYQIFFIFFVTQIIIELNSVEIIVQGARAGIFLFLIFNVLQLIAWFSVDFATASASFNFVDIIPPSYGQLAPRPSGFSLDMNRSGFMLVFFFFCILTFGERSFYNRACIALGLILLLMTFSRSAILACFIFFFGISISNRKKINWSSLVYYFLAFVILFFIVSFLIKDQATLNISALLTERFSFSSGDSGGEHQDLIVKGFEVAGNSIKTIFVGIGFGSSYTVLGDFFGTFKNGNFHSLYVTVLAESGIFSLLLMLAILIIPAVFVRCYSWILIGLIIFNGSYILILDPVFWILIIWSWVKLSPCNNVESFLLSNEMIKNNKYQ